MCGICGEQMYHQHLNDPSAWRINWQLELHDEYRGASKLYDTNRPSFPAATSPLRSYPSTAIPYRHPPRNRDVKNIKGQMNPQETTPSALTVYLREREHGAVE